MSLTYLRSFIRVLSISLNRWLEEQLPQLEEIRGDKMSAFRDIFEHLYEKTHPIRKNLFFLDSLKPIRIIEGKAWESPKLRLKTSEPFVEPI